MPRALADPLALDNACSLIREDLMSACTLNPFLSPTDALTIPEWYVWTEGGDPVGPVSADQIARGIRAGRVPGDAQIARSGGGGWEEALESSAVVEALKAL